MISCKNVANLLMSDQLETQSTWKRMEVRLHLGMCGFCSRLASQIQQLRFGAQQTRVQNEPDPEFEDRIIRRLTDIDWST